MKPGYGLCRHCKIGGFTFAELKNAPQISPVECNNTQRCGHSCGAVWQAVPGPTAAVGCVCCEVPRGKRIVLGGRWDLCSLSEARLSVPGHLGCVCKLVFSFGLFVLPAFHSGNAFHTPLYYILLIRHPSVLLSRTPDTARPPSGTLVVGAFARDQNAPLRSIIPLCTAFTDRRPRNVCEPNETRHGLGGDLGVRLS